MSHKRGTGWRVRWLENGIMRSKTFARKIDADKFEAGLKVADDAPKFTTTLTFNEFAQHWLKTYCRVRKAESQWKDDEATIRRYLSPSFGKKRLLELKLSDIVGVQAHLFSEKGLKPKSVNNFTGIAKKMMEDAVEWELIPKNPFKKLERLKIDEREPIFWSFEEADRFLAYAKETDHNLYEAVAFTLHTGLRFGEVRGLRRDCLNFESRKITVRRHFDSKVHKLFERTKGKRIRRVSMNPFVYDLLKSRRSLDPQQKVFTTDFHNLLNRKLKPACIASGVRVLTFHQLRHTCASHMAMLGVPIRKIQEVLGHKDIKSTMIYSHIDDTSMEGVTDCLVNRIRNVPQNAPTISLVPRLCPL